MRYKGVIFDLDGVIVSTDEYHYRAWKEIADRFQIPFDRNRNDRLRGVSRFSSLEILLEGTEELYSETEKHEMAEEKNAIYRKLLNQMSSADLSDETRNTLVTLKRNGLRLAVGSSSKNTPLILERTGLDHFFDTVVDGNCITYSKPHPEVFLRTAKNLNLLPSECLVVEDADSGVQAAAAGGFDCAGFGGAARNPNARIKLNKISDILQIFGLSV